MKNDMIPMRKIKGKEINVKVEVPKGEKHDREDQRNKAWKEWKTMASIKTEGKQQLECDHSVMQLFRKQV